MKSIAELAKKNTSIYPSARKISEILTDIGLEVEGMEQVETIKGAWKASWWAKSWNAEGIPTPTACRSPISGYRQRRNTFADYLRRPNVAAGQTVLVATAEPPCTPSTVKNRWC